SRRGSISTATSRTDARCWRTSARCRGARGCAGSASSRCRRPRSCARAFRRTAASRCRGSTSIAARAGSGVCSGAPICYGDGMRGERVVRIAEQVIFRPVGDELVLLDSRSGTYYGLDPTGVRVWQLIAEGISLGVIVETMLGEFDVTRERLEADVEALIAELEKRGLVT